MCEISHIGIALVLRYSMGSNGGQRPIFRSWLRKRVYDMDTSQEAIMMQAHKSMIRELAALGKSNIPQESEAGG